MHKWKESDDELVSMYINGKTYREIIVSTGVNSQYLVSLVKGKDRISKPKRNSSKAELLIKNDRPIVYMPDHPRAFQSGTLKGYVYQHIVVAEGKLGRSLGDEEVVHHLDENKHNNNPDNLVVFVNNSAHSRYHKCKNNGEFIHYEDGSVGFAKNPEKRICKTCGNVYYKDAEWTSDDHCSLECARHIGNGLFDNYPSKEELIDWVSKFPMTTCAQHFKCSDKCVRKWCTKYGIPESIFWAHNRSNKQ